MSASETLSVMFANENNYAFLTPGGKLSSGGGAGAIAACENSLPSSIVGCLSG